jgi:hypothetical protein
MTDKIDWAKVPELAQFVATNENGSMWAYEGRPEPSTAGWTCRPGYERRQLVPLPCPHWRDTLVERPKPVKHEEWRWMFGDCSLSSGRWKTEWECMAYWRNLGAAHPVLISWEE